MQNNNANTRFVVGISAGVAHSLAGVSLKQQGQEVVGICTKNWDDRDENGGWTATEDYADVIHVCNKLNIPYYAVNFEQEYWGLDFPDFVDEDTVGRTANPDVMCNK